MKNAVFYPNKLVQIPVGCLKERLSVSILSHASVRSIGISDFLENYLLKGKFQAISTCIRTVGLLSVVPSGRVQTISGSGFPSAVQVAFCCALFGRMMGVWGLYWTSIVKDLLRIIIENKPDKINIRVKNRAIPSYSADSRLLVVRFYWNNLKSTRCLGLPFFESHLLWAWNYISNFVFWKNMNLIITNDPLPWFSKCQVTLAGGLAPSTLQVATLDLESLSCVSSSYISISGRLCGTSFTISGSEG